MRTTLRLGFFLLACRVWAAALLDLPSDALWIRITSTSQRSDGERPHSNGRGGTRSRACHRVVDRLPARRHRWLVSDYCSARYRGSRRPAAEEQGATLAQSGGDPPAIGSGRRTCLDTRKRPVPGPGGPTQRWRSPSFGRPRCLYARVHRRASLESHVLATAGRHLPTPVPTCGCRAGRRTARRAQADHRVDNMVFRLRRGNTRVLRARRACTLDWQARPSDRAAPALAVCAIAGVFFGQVDALLQLHSALGSSRVAVKANSIALVWCPPLILVLVHFAGITGAAFGWLAYTAVSWVVFLIATERRLPTTAKSHSGHCCRPWQPSQRP